MPRREWEAPHFHLERATVETIRAAQNYLVHRLLTRGVPRQGVVVKGVKYASMAPEMCANGEKTGGFPNFLAYKLPKMPLFAKKYFTRYTPETCFEKYINLKIFRYLRHCGVIVPYTEKRVGMRSN
jgi:hypothetical protein